MLLSEEVSGVLWKASKLASWYFEEDEQDTHLLVTTTSKHCANTILSSLLSLSVSLSNICIDMNSHYLSW